MRRRIQAPVNGDTAATVQLHSEKADEDDGPVEEKNRQLTAKQCFFLFTMFVLLTGTWLVLRYLFPQHRYHHLLEIPLIRKLLEEAPAPVDDDSTYVVFVSNANGKEPYNVAFSKSTESAEAALHDALTKIPLKSARWPWFKIDVVTAVKVVENYDSVSKHNDMPSWWYGLAMDWDAGWVFLPDQVQASGLVDWKNRLRWDYLGAYAASRNQLTEWPQTVLEDDSTLLRELQVLHTNAIIVDFQKKETIPLYHGHRIFDHLTHGMLMEAAERAGDYLARNVGPGGKMVYIYRPITDTVPAEYGLTRHAGVIYSMACLYKHYDNKALHDAMKRALDYLLAFVHDCPHPYADSNGDNDKTSKCVLDFGNAGSKEVTKLGLNSLTVLAISEYTYATSDMVYLETAKSIAAYIKSCQKEDGSFVQKIQVKPDNKLDEDYYVRYYQGEATFGMARLYNVVKVFGDSEQLDEDWMVVAAKAASCIVDRDARLEDSDLVVDHWLMYGINEMNSRDKKHVKHCLRIVEVATDRQTQETGRDQDKDRLGIFGGSTSGTATATTTEGMCTVYNMFVKKNPEIAAKIMETTSYSTRFQLQVQFRPEKAMYMQDPLRVLGGFHTSLNNFEMRNDYTQHNLSAFLCMARLLKEQEVAWNE